MPLIRYLTTDLDVQSREHPGRLLAALEARGLYSYLSPEPDGSEELWHVTVGWNTSGDDDAEPEDCIVAMLDAVEALPEPERALWSACVLREFNVGYDSGSGPWAFNNGLSCETLRRMAEAGASLRITIYPPEPDSEEADVEPGAEV